MAEICRHFRVRGRVQGVGYRNFAQRWAEHLGVSGWVRNLEDDSVEAVAQGLPEAVHAFELKLGEGPRWSDVRGVESSEWTLQSGFSGGFRIR